jgi:hypothetical protein
MDEKFMFNVSRRRRRMVQGMNLQQHLCLHWRASTLIQFNVYGNMMAALGSTKNEVCMVL